MTGSVIQPGWPSSAARPARQARWAAHCRSASDAPGRLRSWSRVMCSWIWTAWPATSGRQLLAISRRQASSRASWRRWAFVRSSSGPAFFPRDSSTACSAAAHSGVRFPSRWPAPSKCVDRVTARRVNPSSPSWSGGAQRDKISSARPCRSARSAPPAAAASRIWSASRAVLFGQPVGPAADLPGPRLRDLAGRQRVRDVRVLGQPPGPAQRALGRAAGDPGLPDQPRLRTAMTIGLVPGLRGERGQHPGSRGGVRRLGMLQLAQAVRHLGHRHRRGVRASQERQSGPGGGQRVSSASEPATAAGPARIVGPGGPARSPWAAVGSGRVGGTMLVWLVHRAASLRVPASADGHVPEGSADGEGFDSGAVAAVHMPF